MVEMTSGEVVLSLTAQLASWRAVLALLHTWATCKSWQRKDFHQYYSVFLAACLNQSKQTVWESAGCAAVTESRKVGNRRRTRRFADVDGPGANPEPELGPHGPTLKKQVLKGTDWLDLRLGLQPADSAQDFQYFGYDGEVAFGISDSEYLDDLFFSEAMDPEGSPYSIRKVADTARSSSLAAAAATVPGWRRYFCLGNGK